LEDAYTVFLFDQKAQGHTESTLDFYKARLPVFVRWLEGVNVARLGEVTPHHIRTYLVAMRERGLSGHTIHGAARAIRAWFQFLRSGRIPGGLAHE